MLFSTKKKEKFKARFTRYCIL